MFYLGVDPGAGGGLAVLDNAGEVLYTDKFKDRTMKEIFEMFKGVKERYAPVNILSCIEKVQSMPFNRRYGEFSFGRSYGRLEMALTALEFPLFRVRPQEWQKVLQCRTHGDKTVTKNLSVRLFPKVKVTNYIADALLIALYAHQTFNETSLLILGQTEDTE